MCDSSDNRPRLRGAHTSVLTNREPSWNSFFSQKVSNLGNLGDKVNVKPGYGRNFLLPQGKAVPATADEPRRVRDSVVPNTKPRPTSVCPAPRRARPSWTARLLPSTPTPAPEGKLFGSVGPREIAEALAALPVMRIDKSEVIKGEGPIRHTGEFEVHVHLHADVQTTVKVIVAARNRSKKNKYVVETAIKRAPQGALFLFRHSGRECRNPGCMDTKENA